MHPMDCVFALPQAARADFLRSLVQSFGCTYVCLWQYDSNLSNRLFFLDGFYDVNNNQSSSPPAEGFFHQYRALTFDINDDCVPGVAFRNNLPYLELQQLDLLRLTSTEIQTQFFQEARIEIAVFIGCNIGEIELGFSKMPQDDIQTAITNLFSEDFYIQSQSSNQNPHSSSSSFISLSTGSPDQCSPLLLNIPSTSHSHFPETLPTQTSPHQQTQAFAPLFPSYLPTPEGEHDAIVRAFLRVISSTSHEQQHQPQQNIPNYASVMHQEDTAFKRYRAEISTPDMGSNFQRQSMQNRSLTFFRNIDSMRMDQSNVTEAPRSTSIQQQHHMITERRRREKLNDNFQALRELLPPGTKKTKASILTTARERMRSLIDEIEKLNLRNQQLMTVLSAKGDTTSIEQMKASSTNERLKVEVSHVLESSSSEERMVDLQITVRGESSQVDVLIRLLEFLEGVHNVNLISMGSNNHFTGGTAINQLFFRLRIVQGSEWDEGAFKEAVRRVVADVIQWQLDE